MITSLIRKRTKVEEIDEIRNKIQIVIYDKIINFVYFNIIQINL